MKLAYIRVSATGQDLEAQREAVLKAGAEEVFEDNASGKECYRPALKELLSFARSGDEIVVARLDRFARSSTDLHAMLSELKGKGVVVTFLDNPAMSLDTAHGEMLIAILAATAAFERRLFLTRTEEGRRNAKAKGVKFGRPVKVSDNMVKEIAALRDKGDLSMAEIGKRLGISRRTVYRALDQALRD